MNKEPDRCPKCGKKYTSRIADRSCVVYSCKQGHVWHKVLPIEAKNKNK